VELFDILRRGAAIAPDGTAVVHGDRSVTYRKLLLSASRLGRFLRGKCGEPGERVALLFENSLEYVIGFFAVTQAGYTVVPLDTSLRPERLQFILDDCAATGLLVADKFARYLTDLARPGGPLRLVLHETAEGRDRVSVADAVERPVLNEILGGADGAPFEELIEGIETTLPLEGLTHRAASPAPHEPAAIYYTSGSTGEPKGVMLSHRNLISNTIATVEYLGLTPADSVIVILPFRYIYGNSLLLTHLLVGGRLVIDNRFAFPQAVLKTMAEQKVTGFSGVPSNFMILLENVNFCSDRLPHLRYVTQAGGAMAPEVIRRVMAACPDKQIFIMYGQTEASPRVSYLPPARLADNVGSIGIPVPGVDIRIADDEGDEVAEGEVGEIAVRGDCVMLGYWNQPEATAEVIRGGWLFTGDLARRERGLIYVVSRRKEIIKAGGTRVSAREIEERILEHPDVLEVAVAGVPDDVLGEAVKAFVVKRNGAELDTRRLTEHCHIVLESHKVPKLIEFLDHLPRHDSGKINKQALTSN
jgi:acyl-CoA synthetase (AMP-forming)/AMP-acid ligase II